MLQTPTRALSRVEVAERMTAAEFFRRAGNAFKPVMPNAAGMIESIALPGFKLRLAWLWPGEKFIAVREALKEMNG